MTKLCEFPTLPFRDLLKPLLFLTLTKWQTYVLSDTLDQSKDKFDIQYFYV